ncbi:hypothetical protein Desaci_4090 [Desulfosporosinus acidiphilus SJ4]|uniref:Uncharacterized protein n=1 Tax=Desulfosporosinus acidiphilus (strain DSM 22704 / JCM 16185 / SJ4) TaxID=646529 RepID=I4DAX9_DESAJ|nr:hypothetical protein [Desulfosporosinus acidiphilus]AFM42953.1 hypothetical protein Desaci_4090 [Desulfosporosinus acidiphilus SJ4]
MDQWLTILIILAIVIVAGVGIYHVFPNQIDDFFSNYITNALAALPTP